MLPADRYLANLLGLSEEQYEWWRDEISRRASADPKPAHIPDVRMGIDPVSIAIQIVIAIGLQLIGTLLTPTPSQAKPAQLKARNRVGESQTSLQSFAPRVGFDAVQQVAALGEPIPVVYAKRETIGGVTYGGVRVNATLLWSQIWSLGGSQMLRAVFMLAEGKVASIDPQGFAIGDNSIGVYDLGTAQANELGSRITIYYRDNGGRIGNGNRVVGRTAGNDLGNAINAGAGDVFQLQSVGNNYAADFCSAVKPATSTTFGVYSPVGNNLGFKLNPVVRPGVTARLKPKGDDGDATVVCDIDDTVRVQRAKYQAYFSTRSGITSGSYGAVNDVITYKLLRSSDFETVFQSVSEDDNSWTITREVREWEGVYLEPNYNDVVPGAALDITMNALRDALTVGNANVNTNSKTVTADATLNVSTVAGLYQNSAIGRYKVQYWIIASNTGRDIELRLKFDAIITVRQSKPAFTRDNSTDNVTVDFNNQTSSFTIGTTIVGGEVSKVVNVQVQVPNDSGPVETLSSPSRLRSAMVFDYTEADVYSETADDAASSIATRQRAWDDAIVIGELYKIGSALAVCTGRTPANEVFRSDVELEQAGSGQSIDATFRIVRPGAAIGTVSQATLEQNGLTANATRQTGTGGPHIMRIAIAHGSTTRECRIVELGIRSTLGIRFNGILRYRGTLSFADADNRACLSREGDVIKRGNTVKVDTYQSGQLIGVAERYSFHRLSYRKQGEESFTPISEIIGFVGVEQQAIFNYIRLQFPTLDSWEWQLEPLTGWEIRTQANAANVYVVDARMSTIQTFTSTSNNRTVRVTFPGRVVSRTVETFRLRQTKRAGLGLTPADDDNNHADAWGKLAEFFIFDEIQASTDAPEHEIVYVNEIVPNSIAPDYNGIALLGINVTSAFEWRQFSQISGYVTGGTEVRRLLNNLTEGASHLLPDLALDRLTNAKYGPGRITDDLINLTSFTAAAQWCQNRKYFFDGGVIISAESPRQWIADTAGAMLLDFREVGGRYELVPFIPDPAGDGSTFGQVTHKAMFTAGNIEDGSFQYESVSYDDRQAIQVSVKWRQERSSTNPANPGLFPQEREILVRESAPYGADTDPVEAIDLSDFCTNENHAIDVAKFTIRMRRLRDHTIRFRTTYDGLEGITNGVGPGDFIKVAMDGTKYDEFNNGVVLSNGAIVSTTPLADGVVNVMSWNGSGAVNENATLTIANGIGSPAGIIFTLKQQSVQIRTYQIAKITPADNGTYDIEAVHMPIGSNGRLLVAADWDSGAAWVITR